MARIRSIKPEFWTSEEVMECSPIARLMFIGMWNFADDAGRLPLSPKTIKAQIFPNDPIEVETIRGMIDELASNTLLRIYAVDGKEYLQITGWHHQRIDKPQKAKYPEFKEDSKIIPRTFPPDTIGEEGKGKDQDAAPSGAQIVSIPTPEKVYFDQAAQYLGSGGRSLAAKLLKAKDNNVALAHSALLTASTKSNAREYLGAIIRTREEPECRPDRSF